MNGMRQILLDNQGLFFIIYILLPFTIFIIMIGGGGRGAAAGGGSSSRVRTPTIVKRPANFR